MKLTGCCKRIYYEAGDRARSPSNARLVGAFGLLDLSFSRTARVVTVRLIKARDEIESRVMDCLLSQK